MWQEFKNFGSLHKKNHKIIDFMYSLQNTEPDFCVCKLITSFFETRNLLRQYSGEHNELSNGDYI